MRARRSHWIPFCHLRSTSDPTPQVTSNDSSDKKKASTEPRNLRVDERHPPSLGECVFAYKTRAPRSLHPIRPGFSYPASASSRRYRSLGQRPFAARRSHRIGGDEIRCRPSPPPPRRWFVERARRHVRQTHARTHSGTKAHAGRCLASGPPVFLCVRARAGVRARASYTKPFVRTIFAAPARAAARFGDRRIRFLAAVVFIAVGGECMQACRLHRRRLIMVAPNGSGGRGKCKAAPCFCAYIYMDRAAGVCFALLNVSSCFGSFRFWRLRYRTYASRRSGEEKERSAKIRSEEGRSRER